MKHKVTSGPHLGVVRSWIQWNFLNGDQITWGSQDPLISKRAFTPHELERLAEDIRDAVMDEVVTTQQLGDLASKMVRHSSQTIVIKFDHHRASCTLGGKESPEYLGLEPALKWLFKHLKKLLGEK